MHSRSSQSEAIKTVVGLLARMGCGMHGPIVRARLLDEQIRETPPLAIVAGGLGLHGYTVQSESDFVAGAR